MKKWEYSCSTLTSTGYINDTIESMNIQGQRGWELCSIQWSDGKAICYWKREIENTDNDNQ